MRDTRSPVVLGVLIGTLLGPFVAARAQTPDSQATVAPATPAPAQPSAVDRDVAGRPDALRRLRARAEERYRVVHTRQGLVFVPRRAIADVHGIELQGDQLYIDGAPVSGGELRSRIGSDAEVLLALSYLDEASRRAVFTAPEEAAAPPTARDAEIVRTRTSRRHAHGARVRIGGDVVIGEQERVDDVVAVLGSVVVDGEVAGDVTAVSGGVRLGPKAVVRGQVTSVGGRIDASPGAQILGGRNEIAMSWPDGWQTIQLGPDLRVRLFPDREWWAGFAFAAASVRFAIVGLLGLVVVMVGGTVFRRTREEVGATPWQALLIGIAAQLLLVPVLAVVCGALLVSIIGIPVLALVPVALLALAALWVVGFAAVVERVGRRLLPSAGPDGEPAVLAYVLGFVVIVGLLWIARLAWWMGGIGFGWALALGLVGLAIEGLAWSAGLGALILAWLRRTREARTTVPLPTVPVASGPAGL